MFTNFLAKLFQNPTLTPFPPPQNTNQLLNQNCPAYPQPLIPKLLLPAKFTHFHQLSFPITVFEDLEVVAFDLDAEVDEEGVEDCMGVGREYDGSADVVALVERSGDDLLVQGEGEGEA
jgi:hypothetical protein